MSKKQQFDLGAAVRGVAREAIPVIPKAQVIPSKKHKQAKHKKRDKHESLNS